MVTSWTLALKVLRPEQEPGEEPEPTGCGNAEEPAGGAELLPFKSHIWSELWAWRWFLFSLSSFIDCKVHDLRPHKLKYKHEKENISIIRLWTMTPTWIMWHAELSLYCFSAGFRRFRERIWVGLNLLCERLRNVCFIPDLSGRWVSDTCLSGCRDLLRVSTHFSNIRSRRSAGLGLAYLSTEPPEEQRWPWRLPV